jgi:hypothetical protein
MSDAARKLADWCDEVEQQHEPMSDPADGSVCGQCGWGFPCHAIQGARAVRAAMDYAFAKVAASRVHSDAWCVAGDVLELLAAALEVGRKLRQSRPGISGCRNRAWRRA